jgi:hypothetical protein
MHFTSWTDLEESYVSGQLHPADLKAGVATGLAELQAPVRERFDDDPAIEDFAVRP